MRCRALKFRQTDPNCEVMSFRANRGFRLAHHVLTARAGPAASTAS